MITLPLPAGKFGAILVDPPWRFISYNGGSAVPTQADDPYATLTFSDLVGLDVRSIAADDCALFMWHLGTHTDQAIQLGKEWGFTFKRSEVFDWVKASPGAQPKMGMGYWSRNGAELCALFTRGNPKVLSHDVNQVIFAGRGEHSAKPDETYILIERLVSGPYVELFARQSWPGWVAWGNEVGTRDPLFARLADGATINGA